MNVEKRYIGRPQNLVAMLVTNENLWKENIG
jgi:hypothetical protein